MTAILHILAEAPDLLLILLGLIICIIVYIYLVTRTYRCPACGHTFTPHWNEISVTIHSNGERVVRCPHCHRKGFCPRD